MDAGAVATGSLGGIWLRGRASARTRLARLSDKRWHIAQCAIAAGVSWFIAENLLGHPAPFFAPVAAVVCLGTSYSQRLRRVVEVTIGVALGVFLADALALQIGSGWWQLMIVVALAMSAGLLLAGSQVLLIQATVQSIIVMALVPGPGEALVRWSDAVVGGLVALVAATVVPAAPLRRPREQAAVVVRKIAQLLRTAADVLVDREPEAAAERGLELLADARATDFLIRELHDAAAEGMAVVESSPFRVRHRKGVRRMADLAEPLDRALRSTRVLVRQTAVATYRQHPVPASYARLVRDLAGATDQVADELDAGRSPEAARSALLLVGEATGAVERSAELTAEVVLAQVRSVAVDLLLLTGLTPIEASDTLPPPPR